MLGKGMFQLLQAIPDPDVLLALEPEELAAKLLFLIRNRPDLGARFHAGNLADEIWNQNLDQPSYPREREADISLAMAEAFAWLEAQGLAVPDSGINGSNGWRRLSRRARRIENEADFAASCSNRHQPDVAVEIGLSYYPGLGYSKKGWQWPNCMLSVHYGTSEQN
jgi:hypothetical protein